MPHRRQSLRNPKFTHTLLETVKEAGVEDGCPKAKGNLIYAIASKVGWAAAWSVRQLWLPRSSWLVGTSLPLS